jgi:hypothetical protein
MARTVAGLPAGTRITDYISLGVIARTIPRAAVDRVLAETGRTSMRQRDLPAHVVVYYVIALALYMQSSCSEVLRCLLESVRWLGGSTGRLKVSGTSGISQARTRLGSEPVERLFEQMAKPLATEQTKGAWYRQWRLVAMDGSTLWVADTLANDAAFGRPAASRGRSGFPQIRFVSLVESGTHATFAVQMAPYAVDEIALAKQVIGGLTRGMLCLADRFFPGYALWLQAATTGADLLWRVRGNSRLPCMRRLPDGSYLSEIYPDTSDQRRHVNGIAVRVIEYQLPGVPDAEPLYRLITTILDHEQAPADEVAALYHERWEVETTLDELKTHLRGARVVLRSKTPDLVRQEFFGLMLAHYALRRLLNEAALQVDVDPDRLSFVHAVRVIRRRLQQFVGFPPSEPQAVV